MALICIKHPYAQMSFGVCAKCLENIPGDAQSEVLAAIRDEYETRSRLAERCNTTKSAVNG
jgi:hypothetical protein